MEQAASQQQELSVTARRGRFIRVPKIQESSEYPSVLSTQGQQLENAVQGGGPSPPGAWWHLVRKDKGFALGPSMYMEILLIMAKVERQVLGTRS